MLQGRYVPLLQFKGAPVVALPRRSPVSSGMCLRRLPIIQHALTCACSPLSHLPPPPGLAPTPGVEHEKLLLRLKVHRSAAGIAEAVCSKAADVGADAVVIASHGAGVLSDYGSVARWAAGRGGQGAA